MTAEDSDSIMVPYFEEPQVSVWAVDGGLQMFTNVAEETAALLAELHDKHLYFFAELASPDIFEIKHGDHYRSAETGQFATESEAEAHPSSTVHEEG